MTFYAVPRRRASPPSLTVISDTFTAADDSAWGSLWTPRVTSLNSLATIESNRGRITVNHTVTPPPPAGTATAYNTLGVYRSTSAGNISAFETSAGINRQMPGPVCDFAGGGASWSQRRGSVNGCLDTHRTRVVTNGTNELVLSLRPWPTQMGALLAQMAAGDFNSHYTEDAQTFVSRGYNADNLIIRPMWEFNGGFYPHTIKGPGEGGSFAGLNGSASQAAQRFVDGWRHMVDRMRAVIPGLRFDWCPLRQQLTPARLAAAYPGDAWVDYIGLDAYNWRNGTDNLNLRWVRLVNGGGDSPGGVGLQWHRDFADAHNKQCSFAEWGVTWRENSTDQGGNDPVYITNMIDWFDDLGADGLLHSHCYFEWDTLEPLAHQLHNYPGRPRVHAAFEPSRIAFDARMRG